MEDEECLPENSSLKVYLQSLGFSDLQVIKSTSSNPSNITFRVDKEKFKLPYVETIDEEVINQISIIVSTQMLFEEDISNVEKLLSNFQVVKNGIFRSMFKDLYSVAVIFLGFCLYWVIGYYAFFIVSSFYAFMVTDYLRCKHFNKKRLKKLAWILQTNFILLKKTFKFIEENKVIEVSNLYKNNSVKFMEGFDCYENFKSDFLISVNEMISILTQSTQKLISQIPLHDYIENPKYYLLNNFNKDYEFVDLSKLYEVYLLVQSDFLKRLILSLIPNIKLSTKDSFHDLNKILTETCLRLLRIKNKLNKKYKFLFLNGIHSPKVKVDFKLPLRNLSVNNYCNEFVLNIHEASKTFQKLLIQCRILEENMSEKIPKCVEKNLVKVLDDLNSCQKNINDSLILHKKVCCNTKNIDKHDKAKIQKREMQNSVEKINKVIVGYTDLDPKIEDEIFEAYFTNENSGRDLPELDDWNLDNKVEKKLAKEYSECVLKELKPRLVEKAKYWKRKERELLIKKGIINANEDILEDEQNIESYEEIVNNIVKSDIQMPFEQQKIQPETNYTKNKKESEMLKNNESEKYFDNFSKEIMPNCPIKFEISEINHTKDLKLAENNEEKTLNLLNGDSKFENTHVSVNKGFLNDLNKVREKIFNSSFSIKEELFYGSGEDSSDDNFTG